MFMFMASPTSEWNVFIINNLNPFLVLIARTNGFWQRFGNANVNKDTSI
jgi:hypothetical protein